MSAWQPTYLPPPAEGRAVHVWRIPLGGPGPAAPAAAAALLGEDERLRAARLVAEQDARRFVVARAALRLILAGYLGRPPQSLRFRYSPSGKPALDPSDAPRSLAFNLSHAGHYALLACMAAGQVGVDVERVVPLDYDEIVRLAFSEAEARSLRALDEGERRRAFFLGWTRKEAYLKARGEGLTDGLQLVTVALDPAQPAALLEDRRDPGAPATWAIRDLDVAEGYAGALAVDVRDPLLRLMDAGPYLARLS